MVEKVKELIKQHYAIAVSILVLALIRFTANIPILYLADSQKFVCPREVIQNHDINAIWISVNFSLFERVLNYFIQVWFNDDLSPTIVLNRLASLGSTLLVYLIVYKSSERKNLALISSLIFSLSPALLYIESAVMAEAFFLFFILLFTYLLQLIFIEEDKKKFTTLAIAAGLVIGFAEVTKQTADTWMLLIAVVLLGLALFEFWKSKKAKFFVVAFLIYLFSFVPKIPAYMENARVFGNWDFALQRTVDSGKGVLLWSLTEDMVYSRPKTSYPWLTEGIISVTEGYKKQFAINDKNANTRPFFMAISSICVAGRQQQIDNPYTGQKITTGEWSNICAKYWREVSFSQPKLLLERIFKTSFVNMFLKEDLGLFIWENSLRPGVNFQTIQLTRIPYSFSRQIDPLIDTNFDPVRLSVSLDQVTKVKDIYSYYKYIPDENHYYVMVNADSVFAYKLPINSFSIWWQKLWAWFPWIYIIGPLFLVATVIYFAMRNFVLFDIFVFCSVLYYSILPLLISLAEARYRLQFMPFMILFIGIVAGKYLNRKSQ